MLLVVTGEPSGDTLAARVIEHLDIPLIGMGGPKLRALAPELEPRHPALASMGPLSAFVQAPRYYEAFRRILTQVDAQAPSSALLVGFSAFNGRLGKQLLRRGVRVLWYSPAQVWAWRPERVHALSKSCHRVALLLPFETDVWSATGIGADYVGHPSLEVLGRPREALRKELGLEQGQQAIALLPGSRSAELRRTLEPMLEAARRLANSRATHSALLLADALPPRDQAWAKARARHAGVPVHLGCERLAAFDAALATSGTVTLDCTVAGVPMIVAYRTDWLTAALAKRWLCTEHIALPNIVAGRPVFPELLQHNVTAHSLASNMECMLDNLPSYRAQCEDVRRMLQLPSSKAPSLLVADMLRSWLN